MSRGGFFLDKINLAVAENLKRIRSELGLSLDNTAKLTGVSKSMIGQIERGEVNPTISTVWKIASGFRVSFTELTSGRESDVEVLKHEDIKPLIGADGKVRNYPAVPFDSEKRFEIYTVEIDPGGVLEAEAHLPGTREFITVFEGGLVVEVDGAEHCAGRDDVIRFRADVPHTYANRGNEICRMSMVLYYPR